MVLERPAEKLGEERKTNDHADGENDLGTLTAELLAHLSAMAGSAP